MIPIQYEVGPTYRIQTKKDAQLFTGVVEEQDDTHIKIKTIKGEEVLLHRDDILKAKKWS